VGSGQRAGGTWRGNPVKVSVHRVWYLIACGIVGSAIGALINHCHMRPEGQGFLVGVVVMGTILTVFAE